MGGRPCLGLPPMETSGCVPDRHEGRRQGQRPGGTHVALLPPAIVQTFRAHLVQRPTSPEYNALASPYYVFGKGRSARPHARARSRRQRHRRRDRGHGRTEAPTSGCLAAPKLSRFPRQAVRRTGACLHVAQSRLTDSNADPLSSTEGISRAPAAPRALLINRCAHGVFGSCRCPASRDALLMSQTDRHEERVCNCRISRGLELRLRTGARREPRTRATFDACSGTIKRKESADFQELLRPLLRTRTVDPLRTIRQADACPGGWLQGMAGFSMRRRLPSFAEVCVRSAPQMLHTDRRASSR